MNCRRWVWLKKFAKDGVELSALNPTGGKFHTPKKMAKVYNK